MVAGELPEPKVVEMKEPEPIAPSGPRIVESDITAARAPDLERDRVGRGGSGWKGGTGRIVSCSSVVSCLPSAPPRLPLPALRLP